MGRRPDRVAVRHPERIVSRTATLTPRALVGYCPGTPMDRYYFYRPPA
jgi:hypothetical protein